MVKIKVLSYQVGIRIPAVVHLQATPTRPNSITKISSLEIVIFDLKNDGEKWSRFFYLEIQPAPSELLLLSAEKSAQKGWIGLVS